MFPQLTLSYQVLLALFLVTLNHASPMDTKAIKAYLQKHGYVPEPTIQGVNVANEHREAEEVKTAIVQFQRYNGIPETGLLDEATKARMEGPTHRNLVKQTGRSTSERPHWEGNTVTYNIFKSSSKIKPDDLDAIVKKAFGFWSAVANLKIIKVPTTFPLDVDIGIRFETGYHDDRTPFDGPGNNLAHTSFPPYGRIHLDDDEPWTVAHVPGPYDRDLLSVLVHETGHALGLIHSDAPSDVMYKYYKQYVPGRFGLDKGDVRAIRRLYGKKLKCSGSKLAHDPSRGKQRYCKKSNKAPKR